MTRNWEMRLNFHSGPEFVTARKVVEFAGCEFEAESITDTVPDGTPHSRVDHFIRRGTLFLKVADYLKLQSRLQGIYHRLEVLNPKVTA